jgi:hypothetical protein
MWDLIWIEIGIGMCGARASGVYQQVHDRRDRDSAGRAIGAASPDLGRARH